jgi:putative two-component system response regulator
MKIVVVDDSVTNLIVLKSLSSSLENSSAKGFGDPEVAADYLSENAVDAIVLDFSMPKLNGIQLIERIRSMPLHYSTPIIMVTHASDHATRMCALSAGATAFFSKPIDAANFKAILKNVVEAQRGTLATVS